MQKEPQTFLSDNPDHRALTISALSKANHVLQFADDIAEMVEKAPSCMANSLAKNFTIARMAVQFAAGTNVSLSQINTALARPLDAQMLALINDETFLLTESDYYKEDAPDTRRYKVLDGLSPQVCLRLGKKVLHAYFRASPLTEKEAGEFVELAKSIEDDFCAYDASRSQPTTLTEQEVAHILLELGSLSPLKLEVDHFNYIARAGSLEAKKHAIFKEADQVANARREFMQLFGWDNPKHPINLKLGKDINRVRPHAVILLWRIAKDHDMNAAVFFADCPESVFRATRKRLQVLRRVFAVYRERNGASLEPKFFQKVIASSTMANVAALALIRADLTTTFKYVQQRSLAGVRADLYDLLGNSEVSEEELMYKAVKLLS